MYDNTKVLKFDYRGAPQTIDVMRRAVLDSADQLVIRDLCEKTCGQLDSKDYLSEALAVYNLVLQRCRYMRDPRTVELVRAPHVIAREILAGRIPNCDCDDDSVFVASMLMSMGATCRFVTAAFNDQFFDGRRQYSHVYTQVLEPRTKQWIVVDPVAAERTKKMLREIRAVKTWEI